jgi:hypothetical protein
MMSEELRRRIATLTGIELDDVDLMPSPPPMQMPMQPQRPSMAPGERERLMAMLQMLGGRG